MYSLFIDTLSAPAFICLFDASSTTIDSISWEAKHAEFDTLIESIDTLLIRNAQEYNQIKKIICIV
jgi:tRNA A37 threonylcarbamoyladenosine modification protein TsaB